MISCESIPVDPFQPVWRCIFFVLLTVKVFVGRTSFEQEETERTEFNTVVMNAAGGRKVAFLFSVSSVTSCSIGLVAANGRAVLLTVTIFAPVKDLVRLFVYYVHGLTSDSKVLNRR